MTRDSVVKFIGEVLTLLEKADDVDYRSCEVSYTFKRSDGSTGFADVDEMARYSMKENV